MCAKKNAELEKWFCIFLNFSQLLCCDYMFQNYIFQQISGDLNKPISECSFSLTHTGIQGIKQCT